MKKLFLFTLTFFILSFCILSCENGNDPSNSTTDNETGSSITSEGIITGKIENYKTNSVNLSFLKSEIPQIAPNSKNFKINALVPNLKKISESNFASISDESSTLIYFDSEPRIYYETANNETGRLTRTNMKIEQDEILYEIGGIYTTFAYVDKAILIKGTINGRDIDLNLKKGWNEIACKLKSNTNSESWIWSFSTILPSNLKWYYIKD